MRILIAFATREGQTAKIAQRLAGHLQAAGASVEVVDAASAAVRADQGGGLELGEFDLLVCGASMHAGGLERELLTFIHSHAQQIAVMPRSFFLVLLSAATEDPVLRARSLADADAKMSAQLDVPFDDVERIAGALTYSKYSLPLKWLMQRIAKQAGGGTDTSRDYEYTDWAQVEAYARRLLVLGGGGDRGRRAAD